MIYLFVVVTITLYFYFIEKVKTRNFSKYLAVTLPAFIGFILLPSLQYFVGTDYLNYYNYGQTDEYIYLGNKNEYFFYYIYYLINIFQIHPQFIFFVTSFINTFFFFLGLYLLKNRGYTIYLIVFIFFIFTGHYHNQMNGLRQYIGVFAMFPLIIYILESKWIKSIVLILFSIVSHKSFLIISIFLFFSKYIFNLIKKRWLIFIFIISIPIYYKILPQFILTLVDLTLLNYRHYIINEYGNINILSKLTRFYYLPIYIYFFYIIYFKKNFIQVTLKTHIHLFYYIALFSLLHFYYLIDFEMPIANRFNYYFIIFNIFPIYLVFKYLISKKMYKIIFMYFIFLIFPYLLKTIVFPTNEYSYSSILFN